MPRSEAGLGVARDRPRVYRWETARSAAWMCQRLEHITNSPVVAMNREIALAELEGPEAALALLDRLELDNYRYYHSTRADIPRLLGRGDPEARAAYARELELSQPGAEWRFLESRLGGLPESAGEHRDPRVGRQTALLGLTAQLHRARALAIRVSVPNQPQ